MAGNRALAVMARIRALWPSLGPVGQRIAKFIMDNPREVVHMSVSEVAERTDSSEGSIVGLCKNLGATGFQQIKIALAQGQLTILDSGVQAGQKVVVDGAERLKAGSLVTVSAPRQRSQGADTAAQGSKDAGKTDHKEQQ